MEKMWSKQNSNKKMSIASGIINNSGVATISNIMSIAPRHDSRPGTKGDTDS